MQLCDFKWPTLLMKSSKVSQLVASVVGWDGFADPEHAEKNEGQADEADKGNDGSVVQPEYRDVDGVVAVGQGQGENDHHCSLRLQSDQETSDHGDLGQLRSKWD